MIKGRKALILAGLLVLAAPAVLLKTAHGSDHADTPELAANPGQDISDVFIFPSPATPQNVVLVMDVHPLITSGNVNNVSLDPNVLYQFKIDNTGDAVEDLVIQVKATGTGAGQTISVSGPVKPSTVGTVSNLESALPVTGHFNQAFNPTPGMSVFVGPREDPFFFDLEQFFTIFPDRATPVNGKPVNNPDVPQAATWRPAGQAKDFLSTGHYNVISIVVELPRSRLVRS